MEACGKQPQPESCPLFPPSPRPPAAVPTWAENTASQQRETLPPRARPQLPWEPLRSPPTEAGLLEVQGLPSRSLGA